MQVLGKCHTWSKIIKENTGILLGSDILRKQNVSYTVYQICSFHSPHKKHLWWKSLHVAPNQCLSRKLKLIGSTEKSWSAAPCSTYPQLLKQSFLSLYCLLKLCKDILTKGPLCNNDGQHFYTCQLFLSYRCKVFRRQLKHTPGFLRMSENFRRRPKSSNGGVIKKRFSHMDPRHVNHDMSTIPLRSESFGLMRPITYLRQLRFYQISIQ